MSRLVESFSEAVLEQTPVGIAVVEGEALCFRLANHAYRRMLGIGRDIAGEALTDVYPALDPIWLERIRDAGRTGRSIALEPVASYSVRTADGGPTYWSGHCQPLIAPNGEHTDAVSIVVRDVTEEVLVQRELQQQAQAAIRAREELAHSELRFRGTFDNAAVGIAHIGLDGSWLAANRRLSDILGYPVERLLQLSWQDITYPEDLEADARLAKQLFRGELTSYRIDKRYCRGDGSLIWCCLTVALQYDHSGAPALAIAFIEDISERKRTQEALIEAEQRLRLAVDAAPMVLYSRDRDLRLSWSYNPHDPGILKSGMLRAEKGGLYAADVRRLEKIYRKVIRTGEPAREELEARWHQPPRHYWFDLHVRPLRDSAGDIAGVVCAAYDITELKRTQATLTERETLLRLALDSALMAHWDYDLTSGRVQHTEGLLNLYGLSGKAGWTDIERFQHAVHPDDCKRVTDTLAAAINGGETYFQSEFRVIHPDGRTVWLAARARIYRDSEGVAYRAVGVDMDISEERQLREQLERSNVALEQFAHSVAHDLKAPLQTVLSCAELLRRSQAAQPIPLPLERIRAATLQMNELIDGILTFAQANHIDLQPEPVDVREALEQALTRLAIAVEESKATVTSDPLPVVQGNRILLVQILQNLLANALKYRTERPLEIHVGARRQGEFCILSVRDNGIGIARGEQQRMFEAFSRAHPHANYPGFGLGLSLVKQAVERLNGRIWVESEPGRGTAFFLQIRSV